MAQVRWLPLESNPEVMNKYIHNLGVDSTWNFEDVISLDEESLKTIPKPCIAVLFLQPRSEEYVHALGVPTDVEFHDIYGIDAELLQMVPKPVLAVLLLFPLSDKVEANPIGTESADSNLYFIKQTIGNACGTIGIIHSLANNSSSLNLSDDKTFAKFLQDTKSMSPEEKAKALEENASFHQAHESSALEGQTAAPSRDEKVNLHFVAFVHREGGLYELGCCASQGHGSLGQTVTCSKIKVKDGRRNHPVKHGATTPETLLEDTATVVKKFMARDPEEINFTLVALTKK